MKKIVFIGLLTCLAQGIRAQNQDNMTAEERKETLESLEFYYKMDTGLLFKEALEDQGPSKRLIHPYTPWEAWYKTHTSDEGIADYLFSFDDISLRSVEKKPDVCRIYFRGGPTEAGQYLSRKTCGLWENYYHLDTQENCYGFRKEVFYDLDIDLEMELSTADGRKVYIDTEREVIKYEGENWGDRWYGIELPLTTPLSQIAKGHITLKLIAPQQYDNVEVSTSQTFPQEVCLGDGKFTVEKIDSMGFILSTDTATKKQLDGLEYLYSENGTYYKPSHSGNYDGDLKDILKYDRYHPSFEEWLTHNGIDTTRLKTTAERYFDSDDTSGRIGKNFYTGISGERLLIYRPTQERVVATATLSFPPSEHAPQVTIDNALCHEILRTLLGHKTEENPQATTTEVTQEDCTAEELLLSLGEAPRNPAAEAFDFATPDQLPEMNTTAYAIGYYVGYELLAREGLTAKFYKKSYAQWLHKGYEAGVKHSREIISRDDTPIVPLLESTEDLTQRLCCYWGIWLGALCPSEKEVVKEVDALIDHVMTTCRTQYSANNRHEYAEYEYCLRLQEAWEEYLTGEMNYAYNSTHPQLAPSYPVSDHFSDASIPAHWIDTLLTDADSSIEALRRAAVAKFEPSDVEGGAPALKNNTLLSVGEHNALLASNELISYAAGVVQAERIMRSEEAVPTERGAEFINALHTEEGRAFICRSFAAGVQTATALMPRNGQKEALTQAIKEAYEKGRLNGKPFEFGSYAVMYYRMAAAWDTPSGASGRAIDTKAVIAGFSDFVEKRLKMGAEYAISLMNSRAALVMDLGERTCASPLQKDFREVKAIDPMTLIPAPMERVLPKIVSAIGIEGRLTARLTIEADGVISKVELSEGVDPRLAEMLTDALYRMRFTPAQVGDTCVARIIEVPFIFR